MRSYCSLYIDAGYLMSAASTRITGTSLRQASEMDVPGLLGALADQVEQDSGLPLLRIHWYDAGTRAGTPSGNQRDIAIIPKVKLRLGRVGFSGEQKGVDLKLALDLITQSRNQVAEVVYLVSGDDDLSEAVEEAQHLGVQVISLVVPDENGRPISVSQHLQATVDQLQLIDGASVDAHVRRSASAVIREVAAATAGAVPVAPEPVADGAVAAAATGGAEEGPACPSHAAEPVPAPSPLLLARTRPAVLQPALAGTAEPRVVPAYTTTTGEAARRPDGRRDAEVLDAIGDVVDKVVLNWWRGASAASRAELDKAKPTIPPDLDRALLNDLSHRLALFDIPQSWRFALRDAFWEKLQRL